MSTDLTTTIILREPEEQPDYSFRFVRTPSGALRITTLSGDSAAFCEEDAIMLRDWLNDEWPVADAVPAEPEEYLWGEEIGWPQKGCPCPDCEKARGR